MPTNKLSFERQTTDVRWHWVLVGVSIVTMAGCNTAAENSEQTTGSAPERGPRGNGDQANRDFSLLYVLDGGDRGGIHQAMLITTNLAAAPDAPITTRDDENFDSWREIYLVPRETAARLETLLRENGYFELRSTQGDVNTDMYRWSVSIRSGAEAKRVEAYEWAGALEEFERTAPRQILGRDSEEAKCGKTIFDIVNRSRELAQREGRLVDGSK